MTILALFDFSTVTEPIYKYFVALGGETLAQTASAVIVASSFMGMLAIVGMALVYIERKVSAFMQLRLGPMRVGYYGTLQALADVMKLAMKESFMPTTADSFLFNIAPYIVMIAALMTLGAMPFAKGLHFLDMNVGLFYVSAISSIGVIGILLAGWSSNNKYSLIGAMRSGAQIVSYELSAGLSLVAMAAMMGSLQLSTIVESQANGWWIFKAHFPAVVSFVIFLIASVAETNRAPFDLPEAESELTAGFHTEYSGIKFAFFFLAEYVNVFVASALAATVYFGGWMPFHVGNFAAFNNVMDFIPPIVWFFGKTFAIIFVIMWFRWTFPRLRIDQLLTLEWKYLLPLSLLNTFIAALVAIMGWTF